MTLMTENVLRKEFEVVKDRDNKNSSQHTALSENFMICSKW